MVILLDLLRKGYFPKELPPPFETETFANYINNNINNIPNAFLKKQKFDTSEHNIVRVGVLRRKLGIPNPFTQFILSKEIVNYWARLDRLIQISNLSISKPRIINGENRALCPWYCPRLIPYIRTYHRTGAKYVLKTDISNFYYSIYTHVIPWAIHNKKIAKAHIKKNRKRYLGNRLDEYIRNGQDNQTIGIPVGPDTSLLLSEIILCKVDYELSKGGALNGFRYIDDYELYFQNLSDAEKTLNALETILSNYELYLNHKKTSIKKLPLEIDDKWVTWLNKFEFRDGIIEQKTDLKDYFSQAFDFSKDYPELSVLRYALKKLTGENIYTGSWPLLQSLMLQCISSEPNTLPYVLDQYVRFTCRPGFSLNANQSEDLKKVLNQQIQYHAPHNHGSEVAWSLWGCLAFGLKINKESAKVISDMEDSIVILLALDAESRHLFLSSLDKTEWLNYMDSEGLYSKQWLVSYEANVKNWLPSKGGQDHVHNDSRFRFLKANNVQFYNINQAARVLPKATEPICGCSNFPPFGSL